MQLGSGRPARRPSSSSSPHPWPCLQDQIPRQSRLPSCNAGDVFPGTWTFRGPSRRSHAADAVAAWIPPANPLLGGGVCSLLRTAKHPSGFSAKAGSPQCPALVFLNHVVHQNPLPTSPSLPELLCWAVPCSLRTRAGWDPLGSVPFHQHLCLQGTPGTGRC